MVLKCFHLNPGTGGVGAFKGGDGVVREFLFRKPLTLSILTERRVFAPYGLQGTAQHFCHFYLCLFLFVLGVFAAYGLQGTAQHLCHFHLDLFFVCFDCLCSIWVTRYSPTPLLLLSLFVFCLFGCLYLFFVCFGCLCSIWVTRYSPTPLPFLSVFVFGVFYCLLLILVLVHVYLAEPL